MNFKNLLAKFQEKNITDIQCWENAETSCSIEVFNNELVNYSCNKNNKTTIAANIDNKLIINSTEYLSNNNIDQFINDMIDSAKYIKKEGAYIYGEKSKYHHYSFFNKDYDKVDNQEKIDLLFEIERRIKAYDKRIDKCEVAYSETILESHYQNSKGIKLKKKSNAIVISADVVIKEDTEIKSEYRVCVDNDIHKLNIDLFVKELCDKAISKLHPIQLKSKKYNVIFSPEVTSDLLGYYVSQLNAELVLKNSSWFKDKINTEVASKRLSIIETPLKKNINFCSYDAEGVPTQNLTLIKRGVLTTYLHNLETASRFNVNPNGHASLLGAKIGIAPHRALYIKSGKLSKDEMLTKLKNGIYITSLEGFHAGMNAQSGDFSLKAEGILVKDGKLDKAIDMMTVNSNLFTLFKDVKRISQNIEYLHNNHYSPCIAVNKIAISF